VKIFKKIIRWLILGFMFVCTGYMLQITLNLSVFICDIISVCILIALAYTGSDKK